jgi:hypothetical protein
MAFVDDRWLIRVQRGGDALRAEQLTRELRDELDAVEGIAAGIVQAGPDAAIEGSKGATGSDLVLWASIATPAAAAGARILITLIKEWCARDRHRKVELTYNGNSATIVGQSGDQLRQIIELFGSDSVDSAGDSSDRPTGHEADAP